MENLCKLKEVFKVIYNFEAELKKAFGLSLNEALALCSLSKKDSNAGDLADEIGISVSRMSRVIASLENKKLIKRKMGKEDKRQMFFSISETGKKKSLEIQASTMKMPDITVKI